MATTKRHKIFGVKYTVSQIIDTIFEDMDNNRVNHHLLETILAILASQLNVLERKFEVSLENKYKAKAKKEKLMVYELKVHAGKGKKKKKRKQSTDEDSSEIKTKGKRTSRVSKMDLSKKTKKQTSKDLLQSIDKADGPYKQEKILFVGRGTGSGTIPQQPSVVTRTQFDELVAVVRQLYNIYNPNDKHGFELMASLRMKSSLSEPTAVIQMSTRLQNAEKTLQGMLTVLGPLAKDTLNIDVMNPKNPQSVKTDGETVSRGVTSEPSVEYLKTEDGSMDISEDGREKVAPKDCVSRDEFYTALDELADNIVEKATNTSERSTSNTKDILETIGDMEKKFKAALEFRISIAKLEGGIEKYVKNVNGLDSVLVSKVTSYQDELTQMQTNLEIALENLQEEMARSDADPEVIAELSENMKNLQPVLESTAMKQRKLKIIQQKAFADLTDTLKTFEMLCALKSDRQEVADLVSEKAGISQLNGLVHRQQFDAYLGDIQKRIGAAYKLFNQEEATWQKIIDDIIKTINEKVDEIQIVRLSDEINKYLNIIGSQIDALFKLVGAPKVAVTSKIISRDAACLSCSAAVPNKDLVEDLPMSLALPGSIEAIDGSKTSNETDHEICYPGLAIPHMLDPRSHFCQRFCGSSISKQAVNPMPDAMMVTSLQPCVSTITVGIDDESLINERVQKPCGACNAPAGVQTENSGIVSSNTASYISERTP